MQNRSSRHATFVALSFVSPASLGWAAVAAAVALGCSSSSSSGSGAQAGPPPGESSPDGGAPSASDEGGLPPPTKADCSAVRAPTGSVTYKTRDNGAISTYTVPEAKCTTLRDPSGAVVGYAASFVSFDTYAATHNIIDAKAEYLTVIAPRYIGDGTYATDVRSRFKAPTFSYGDDGKGTLVLSNGGKSGHYTVGSETGPARPTDLYLDATFSCDPADDVAPTAGPALPATPPPGTAVVVATYLGAAYQFTNFKCASYGDSYMDLYAPSPTYSEACSPLEISLTPTPERVSAAGTFGIFGSTGFNWFYVERFIAGSDQSSKVTLTGTGTRPEGGTAALNTTGTPQARVTFTCPTP